MLLTQQLKGFSYNALDSISEEAYLLRYIL